MQTISKRILTRALMGLCFVCTVQAESTVETEPVQSPSVTDFLSRDWYEQNNVVLPRQVGIGYNYIYMNRDIEVTDVRVSFLDIPPQSISDMAAFAVENKTTLSMARIDAWVLPFLDLYLMLGETRTDTALSVTFETEAPGGGMEEVTVVEQSKVNGPLYGVGGTLVYGGKHWFCMGDANYSRSDLAAFDAPMEAWYLSSRIGWHKTAGKIQYRVWGGLAYLDSARTLSVSVENRILGTINVQVDQQPVNPWNAAIGGSVSINRRWDLLAEYGSNFSDATVVVFSVSARFF